MEGTTRERFISILQSAPPRDQAKIIRGVLEKYPVASFEEKLRPEKQQLYDYFESVAAKLDGLAVRLPPQAEATSEAVEAALADAEILLRERGPASVVDRLHTALHGYLRNLAEQAEVSLDGRENLPRLFVLVRDHHPALKAQRKEIAKVAKSMASALDALNDLRNQASSAHPGELLGTPEAHLAVNASATVFQYLRERTQAEEGIH
jgi:hypothetical protein